MSTVPSFQSTQALRRVPYLLGSAAAHVAPPISRHAWPALFLPQPRIDSLVATGCRTH